MPLLLRQRNISGLPRKIMTPKDLAIKRITTGREAAAEDLPVDRMFMDIGSKT